jgi:thiol-disulfide isomerase/thioredoxin/Flp pilus assembly protein TadD
MFKKLAFACVAMMLVVVPCAWGQADAASAAPAADDFHSNPKFVDAMKEAKLLEHSRQMIFAIDDYKKANKLAGGKCMECLHGLYTVSMKVGEYKDAIAASTQMEALAKEPKEKSAAAVYRGEALLVQGGEKPNAAHLEAAHAAFQDAITLNSKNANALFFDGKTLAQMGKIEEARTDFQQCVSCVTPNDPARLRAEHFAENPELATHKMAPPLAVTALDGSKFNLDAMGGRVVLIDFWATWCGPCNAELPHMQKIAKEFAGQPLVIISVSWDADEAKWKDFIQKHEMTWVQYRDADHKLSEQFGINAIPHYFTIDSDGVLTAEMMGSGSDVEGKLKKLIKRAEQAKATVAAGSQGGTIPAGGN